jgi:branched-chain amino acid transport system substrate-binding protein
LFLPSVKVLKKIQPIILVVLTVVSAVAVGSIYILFEGQNQPSETIKIGVLADLDGDTGKDVLQGAILAAENLNAEGGILGRQVEVIGEDSDEEYNRDLTKIGNALTRLLTFHNVDFVIASGSGEKGYMIQALSAEHKKILISYGGSADGLTQNVIDNYDKYKYYFRYMRGNTTYVVTNNAVNRLLHIREITGFNNVGYLADDSGWNAESIETLEYLLPELGFNLVYRGKFPPFKTFDFSSYFAAAESAGVEILWPLSLYDSGISLVKEYNSRQSPMLIYGGSISRARSKGWEETDGKCVYTVMPIRGVTIGYPTTNQTLPFYNSYIQRWGEAPTTSGATSYDIIRFVLSEALKNAGTTETEEIIKTLEETVVETTQARKFAFTSSHDVLYKESNNDYGHIFTSYQWQEDGSLIPIYPEWLMKEANVTLTFPKWPGPWDKQ